MAKKKCIFCGEKVEISEVYWDCPYCGNTNYDDCDDVEEDDEDCGEYISVYDAANIWMSRGCDEDDMFGYTEEELREALKW
jgi:hypothetical protein